MPSRLSGQVTQAELKGQSTQLAKTTAPWGGFWGNIHPDLVPPSAFIASLDLVSTTGLNADSEVLTWDYGWRRFQGNTSGHKLPLGNVSTPFPGTNNGSPILGLDLLPALGGSADENIAVTAKASGTNGTVFVLGASGDWNAMTTDNNSIASDATAFFDSTIYPDYSGASRQGACVFTTGILPSGGLFYYPSSANHYAQFTVAASTLPDGTNPRQPNLTNFQCAAVLASKERLLCLNTIENGVKYPARLRYTTIGWTTPTAGYSSNPNIWGDPGSGILNFGQFFGVGLRLLEIGDRIVLYFEDGVSFLDRTGDFTNPYAGTYLTKHRGRGLISAGAVCDVGGGVHFGAFTDGFFLLSQDGTWTELGTQVVSSYQQTAAGQRPVHIRKWFDYFTVNLNQQYRSRIRCDYNEERRFVYFSWPDLASSGTNNRVWCVDIYHDRVWPVNWANPMIGIHPQWPFAMNRFRAPARPGRTWGQIPDRWIDRWTDPWTTWQAVPGLLMNVHGTENGMVWVRDQALVARDGTYTPTFLLQSAPMSYGQPYMAKNLSRRWMEYRPGPNSKLQVTCTDGGNQASFGSRNYVTSNTGTNTVHSADFNSVATFFKWLITGTHPVQILGWSDEISEAGEPIR
jgi:hypothetical protein